MASRQQRKMAMRRKLHVLRTLTSSNSVKKKSIVIDALLYIYKLKLQLEALKKELLDLTEIRRRCWTLLIKKQLIQLPNKEQVKVEKAGKGFIVRVFCEKGEDHKLVRILEAFEEMGLVALQAKVSCTFYFAMEAIVVAQEPDEKQQLPPSGLVANTIARAILKAIEKQGVEMENTKGEN